MNLVSEHFVRRKIRLAYAVKLNEKIIRKLVLTILIIITQSILSFSNDSNNLYRTVPFI